MHHRIDTILNRLRQDFGRHLDLESILSACREVGHGWRKWAFDTIAVVHWFVVQVLHGNTSLEHVVNLGGRLFHRNHVTSASCHDAKAARVGHRVHPRRTFRAKVSVRKVANPRPARPRGYPDQGTVRTTLERRFREEQVRQILGLRQLRQPFATIVMRKGPIAAFHKLVGPKDQSGRKKRYMITSVLPDSHGRASISKTPSHPFTVSRNLYYTFRNFVDFDDRRSNPMAFA